MKYICTISRHKASNRPVLRPAADHTAPTATGCGCPCLWISQTFKHGASMSGDVQQVEEQWQR